MPHSETQRIQAVKVFSATKAHDRQALGDRISTWIQTHPEITVFSTIVSTTAYVNPVVAVILGWALLGETLAPRALAGAALIVCAVAVMTLRLPSRRPSEALPMNAGDS